MRRSFTLLACASCVLVLTAFRCPGPDPLTSSNPAPDGGGGVGGTGPGSGGGGDGGGTVTCGLLDEDDDGDGYSENDGDCNDCDPFVNPDMAELPTLSDDEPVDDNCDGHVDEEPVCEPADNALTPEAAARAIELCDDDADKGWGLVSAHLVNALGGDTAANSLQVALTGQFGSALSPRMGGRMLVLSTGHAADADDPTACADQSCGSDNSVKAPPPGYPIAPAGCVPAATIYDDVALEVTVRPPPNAGGFSFYSAYLTHEYVESVCSQYEDQFLALVTPTNLGTMGSNVIFDDMGIPPSASFKPFHHCDPEALGEWAFFCGGLPSCPPEPDTLCELGPSLLAGTGFAPIMNATEPTGGATTGWLKTYVPLADDELIKVRFLIFDTGDWYRDSTVLIDGFRWLSPDDLPDDVPVTELK